MAESYELADELHRVRDHGGLDAFMVEHTHDHTHPEIAALQEQLAALTTLIAAETHEAEQAEEHIEEAAAEPAAEADEEPAEVEERSRAPDVPPESDHFMTRRITLFRRAS